MPISSVFLWYSFGSIFVNKQQKAVYICEWQKYFVSLQLKGKKENDV
jgi:hypothetical protein